MADTIYFVTEPFLMDGLRYEIEATPVESMSAKLVRVKGSRGSRYRRQLPREECHFSADSALLAKEAEVAAVEKRARVMRDALEALRSTLTGGPASSKENR